MRMVMIIMQHVWRGLLFDDIAKISSPILLYCCCMTLLREKDADIIRSSAQFPPAGSHDRMLPTGRCPMRRLWVLLLLLAASFAVPAAAQQAGSLIAAEPVVDTPPGVQAW